MARDFKVVGTAVTCSVCGKQKKPRGRSAPMDMTMCYHNCPGYDQEPHVGQLWPGETDEEFGYPVTPYGSDERVDYDGFNVPGWEGGFAENH